MENVCHESEKKHLFGLVSKNNDLWHTFITLQNWCRLNLKPQSSQTFVGQNFSEETSSHRIKHAVWTFFIVPEHRHGDISGFEEVSTPEWHIRHCLSVEDIVSVEGKRLAFFECFKFDGLSPENIKAFFSNDGV